MSTLHEELEKFCADHKSLAGFGPGWASHAIEAILARHPAPVVLAEGEARTGAPPRAAGFGEGDDPSMHRQFMYQVLMLTPRGHYRLLLERTDPPKEAQP